jgi:hypothetical protein
MKYVYIGGGEFYIYLGPLKRDINLNNVYKYPVRTSQETQYVSATKTNRLMLFRETVAVYCANHTEHTESKSKLC